MGTLTHCQSQPQVATSSVPFVSPGVAWQDWQVWFVTQLFLTQVSCLPFPVEENTDLAQSQHIVDQECQKHAVFITQTKEV